MPGRFPVLALLLLLVAACAVAPQPSRTPETTTMPPATPTATSAATPTPTPKPTPTPTPTPEVLFGTLEFAADSDRQVPADGVSAARVQATVSNDRTEPADGREVELRALAGANGLLGGVHRVTDRDGTTEFEVSSLQSGRVELGLFVAGGPGQPLATLEVEFTRKVVLLAPGFQSALAHRFLIFGEPRDCSDPARPASITEALICLGYTPNSAEDPGHGSATPGATILDMSWEPTRCLESEPAEATHCLATIGASADGTEALWQPADYDLAELALSLTRQSSIDVWARRLVVSLLAYDAELSRTAGVHASFFLVGHSMGGEVVVRSLRAALADPELARQFEGENRGRLQLVLSVDGALNWTGTIEFLGATACGFPVRTVASPEREVDNVDAVEQAFDRFGTETVAITAEADPVVPADVALLRSPVRPERGYSEGIFSGGAECAHAGLLLPDPQAPETYPLASLFRERIGPAGGYSPSP